MRFGGLRVLACRFEALFGAGGAPFFAPLSENLFGASRSIARKLHLKVYR